MGQVMGKKYAAEGQVSEVHICAVAYHANYFFKAVDHAACGQAFGWQHSMQLVTRACSGGRAVSGIPADMYGHYGGLTVSLG